MDDARKQGAQGWTNSYTQPNRTGSTATMIPGITVKMNSQYPTQELGYCRQEHIGLAPSLHRSSQQSMPITVVVEE